MSTARATLLYVMVVFGVSAAFGFLLLATDWRWPLLANAVWLVLALVVFAAWRRRQAHRSHRKAKPRF